MRTKPKSPSIDLFPLVIGRLMCILGARYQGHVLWETVATYSMVALLLGSIMSITSVGLLLAGIIGVMTATMCFFGGVVVLVTALDAAVTANILAEKSQD